MGNENIIRETLGNTIEVRLDSEPEKLFHVSGDTIMFIYDHFEHILYCRYEDFWENLTKNEHLRSMVTDSYKEKNRIDHIFTIRPGIYQGNYLKRKRALCEWSWETIKEIPLHHQTSEGPTSIDVESFLP